MKTIKQKTISVQLIRHSSLSLLVVPRIIFILLFSAIVFSCNRKKVAVPKMERNGKTIWTAEDKIRNKNSNPRPVIVLDAGHGGYDSGGLSLHDSIKLKEKDLTLFMSELLFKKLDKKRFNVIRVRTNDTFLHRHERTELLEYANPDLLISLHTNFDPDTNINGFEFAYSGRMLNYIDSSKNQIPPDTINIDNPFADLLTKYCLQLTVNTQRTFPTMRRRHLKERTDRIWMLYGVHYPSILAEFGFISGASDVLVLADKKKLEKYTDVLAKTITSFFPVVKRDSFYLPPLGKVPVIK